MRLFLRKKHRHFCFINLGANRREAKNACCELRGFLIKMKIIGFADDLRNKHYLKRSREKLCRVERESPITHRCLPKRRFSNREAFPKTQRSNVRKRYLWKQKHRHFGQATVMCRYLPRNSDSPAVLNKWSCNRSWFRYIRVIDSRP